MNIKNQEKNIYKEVGIDVLLNKWEMPFNLLSS